MSHYVNLSDNSCLHSSPFVRPAPAPLSAQLRNCFKQKCRNHQLNDMTISITESSVTLSRVLISDDEIIQI